MSGVSPVKRLWSVPDMLGIEWADGTMSEFASLWLRDNLREDRDPHSGQRLIDIADLPEDPKIRELNHRIEFIRDNSHSRSLTHPEFESMFVAAGLRIIELEHKGHPRTFEHWMHVAGWKPSDPEYQEAHALMVDSIETNSANFSPRFEPADVCQPGKAPDLYMFNPGIYIAAEKI